MKVAGIHKIILSLAAIVVVSAARHSHAALVYSEDFTTSPPIVASDNGYVGGWFSNQISFGTWTGQGQNGTPQVSGGAMTIQTFWGGTQGAATILAPFAEGAGEYSLSYDLALSNVDATNSGDYASVAVFFGSGYNLAGNSGDALQFDLQNATPGIVGLGTAVASGPIASATYSDGVTGGSLNFNYDGTSAVAIVFSTYDGGSNPVDSPLLSIDNVAINSVPVTAIPEPTTLVFLVLMAVVGAFLTKRQGTKQLRERDSH